MPQQFRRQPPLEDPEARLSKLGLPTVGPEIDDAQQVLAGHSAVMDMALAAHSDALADAAGVKLPDVLALVDSTHYWEHPVPDDDIVVRMEPRNDG